MANRQEWQARIARWRTSGLSKRQYALREGFSAQSFAWWSWKLSSEQRAATAQSARRATARPVSSSAPTVQFFPVHVVDSLEKKPTSGSAPASQRVQVSSPTHCVELTLPHGCSLHVPTSLEHDTLRRVLSAALEVASRC